MAPLDASKVEYQFVYLLRGILENQPDWFDLFAPLNILHRGGRDLGNPKDRKIIPRVDPRRQRYSQTLRRYETSVSRLDSLNLVSSKIRLTQMRSAGRKLFVFQDARSFTVP